MASVRPAAFVGRAREVGILTTALARARLGAGGLVAITGEAGGGKTRLAEELTARAADDGVTTAWGAAWTGGGAPPPWPGAGAPPPLRPGRGGGRPPPPP